MSEFTIPPVEVDVPEKGPATQPEPKVPVLTGPGRSNPEAIIQHDREMAAVASGSVAAALNERAQVLEDIVPTLPPAITNSVDVPVASTLTTPEAVLSEVPQSFTQQAIGAIKRAFGGGQ